MDFDFLGENFSAEEIELQKQEFERIQQEKLQEALLKEMQMEQDFNQNIQNDIQNIGDYQQKASEPSSNAAKKKQDNQRNKKKSPAAARENSNKNIFDVRNLNLENEIGMTQQEIEVIDQSCNQILTEENVKQLKEKYDELKQSVQSLFNNDDMYKQTKEQLIQFQKSFIDAIRMNEQQSSRIVTNKISEYLANKFSNETNRDLTKIFMDILIKCKEKDIYLANRLEIIRQFQKYIMTGILNGVDCNIFRCICEHELNEIIFQTVEQYIDECKKTNINRKDLNTNANQVDVLHLQQMQDQQQKNDANIIEKDFMDLGINQVINYYIKTSDNFNENILSNILEVYAQSLTQIKNKLNQAQQNIEKVEKSAFKQENPKYLNGSEKCLKRLARAIYYRKAQQNIIDTIDYFEQLNNQVNHIISQEINRGLSLVSENQQNLQPIFFLNFFDHTINQIVSIFAEKTIPQSLKTLLEEEQSLDHVKASIIQQKNEQIISFQQKNHHQQNEESKKIMDTNYFNAFKDLIQSLAFKSKEWSSYFVVSMSKFDVKNDAKSKYCLMLHEITFGKLKEVMSLQQEKYTMVKNAQKIIQDLWLKLDEDLKHLNFKAFCIYFRNYNSFSDQNMMQGEENTISINFKGDQVKYKICFLQLIIKQNMKIQQDKREEFIDFLLNLIKQIGKFNHILTLFFFYLYEQCQNKEISLATFSCEDFKNYVYNTIAEAQVFGKFYNFSETVNNFSLAFEICQLINRLNVDYDKYYNQHIDELNQNVIMNRQSKNVNIRYFQHYLNKDQQLTAFIVGKIFGNFTIGVQNFQIEFQEDTKPILSFTTYYSQFLFTQIFNERYIRDKLEILFYHFCCFLKERVSQETTLVEFNPTLLVNFQSFIQEIENQLKIPLNQSINVEGISNQIIQNPYEVQQQQIQQQLYQSPSNQLINFQNEQQNEIQPNQQNNVGQHLYKQIIENFQISRKQADANEEEQVIQEKRMNQLNIQQDIDNEKAELENFKQKISELENELENLKSQNQIKEQEIAQIKQEHQVQIQNEQNKLLQLEEAQNNYLKLIQDLENNKNINQQADQKIQNLQYEQNEEYIQALQNASDQKLSQKQKEIEGLQQELLQIQENLESINQELNRSQQKIIHNKEDLLRICNEKQEILNQVQEKERFIKQQEIQLMELKQKLLQAEEQSKILQENSQTLKNQYMEIENKLQNSIQVEDVKQLMAPIYDSFKQLQINSSTLLQNPLISPSQVILNQIDGEQFEQDELFNCKDYYSESIKFILNDIKSLNKQINQINKQVIQLNLAITDTHSKQQAHQQNQIYEFSEQIAKKECLLKELQEKIEAKMNQLDEIENQKIQFNEIQQKALQMNLDLSKNEQAQNQIEEQIKKNEELQTNLNKMHDDYQKIIEEKDQLLQKINDLQEQNQQLINQSQQYAQQQHFQSQIYSKQEELESINQKIILKQQELESLSKMVNEQQQQQQNGQTKVNNIIINQNSIIEGLQVNSQKKSIVSNLNNFEYELSLTSKQLQQLQNESKMVQLPTTLNNKLSENTELLNNSLKMEIEQEVKTEYDINSSPISSSLVKMEDIVQKSQQKENNPFNDNSSNNFIQNPNHFSSSNEKFNEQKLDIQPLMNKEFLFENNFLSQQQNRQILQNSLTLQTNQIDQISQNGNDSQHFYSQKYDRSSIISQTIAAPYTRNQIKRNTSNCVNEKFEFNLNLFCQIYYNPESRSKLIKFLIEKYKIRVLFFDYENKEFENLDSITQDIIIIIDNSFNAFIYIQKTQSFFSWKQNPKCNKSINKQFLDQKIGQEIVKKYGKIQEEFETFSDNKTHEIAQLLFNQLQLHKKEFLFQFVMNSNLLRNVQIQFIDTHLNQAQINQIFTSFQNSQDQEILVLVSYNSFFYTYRYFNKINGSLNRLYQTYVKQISLNQQKILEMIQEDQNLNSNFLVSKLLTEIKYSNDQEYQQILLFLLTYGPLIILQKLQEGCANPEELFKELNETFQNTERYNYYTLQQDYI
ncbi:hypothetical protein TTHERM_00011449 (macronuclear) [Tetrahymena thermophila SB210]|uniref:Uncharacterized protein n=1 Tax=Tetrahymena thermophila (strain SB210) TaxID=312017 RepID=A4VES4_TETTS|nr:hypothetical protein TTHERM_00011449 [Tetrahymena thermophila SB210]EDK32016.2 hypothetical protein TTHERM_00011449 [Tetrahymena thermophila SB210]|eukprot:XP_001471110.2 hypothetical protein TTHERM_00011449 [Tetrahymena thermophila SB210]